MLDTIPSLISNPITISIQSKASIIPKKDLIHDNLILLSLISKSLINQKHIFFQKFLNPFVVTQLMFKGLYLNEMRIQMSCCLFFEQLNQATFCFDALIVPLCHNEIVTKMQNNGDYFAVNVNCLVVWINKADWVYKCLYIMFCSNILIICF